MFFFSKLKDFWEYFFLAALFVETMFQLDCLFIIAWIWVQPCPIMQSKNNLFHVICLMNLHFPPLVVQGYTQNMYTPNSPELWRNLCPFSLSCIIFKIKKAMVPWIVPWCHLKKKHGLFVSGWFQILTTRNKQAGISPWMTIQISTPKKRIPTLHPWKRTLVNPKKCRFRVDDFPFLSGQPAGRFVVRPGIWIRRYDSSSPWLWGAAGPMMAQWTTQTNSEFTPPKLAQIAPKPGNQLSFNHWFSGVNLLSVSGRVRDS